MPTDADLARLEALLQRLGPLAAKSRGELIRSAEWNELVGAVTELTRAVLGEDRTSVVAPHEHSEQVALGWLSPDLRRLLSEGPLADAGALGRLGRSERDIGHLATRLDGIAADLDAQRGRVADVATNDLAREATLVDFGRRLSGVGDARDAVADVRRTLSVVQTDVQRAIEVGQRLDVGGQPLDVRGLLARVGALEELRTRLTLPTGALLDAVEFQRQVQALETRLVTEEELDRALETVRRADVPADVRDAIAARAADTAGERLSGRLAQVEEDLRADITVRFGEVDAVVSAAIAGAAPDITATAVEHAAALVRRTIADTDAAIRSAVTAELDSRLQRMATEFNTHLDDLRRRLPERLEGLLADGLAARLDPVDARVAALEGVVESTQGGLAAADVRSRTLETRVEQVNREGAAARAALVADLRRQIDDLAAGVDGRVATAVAEARAGVAADVRSEVGAMRASIEARLAERTAELVRTEVRLLRGQIDTNVRALVQDELVATRGELLAQVDQRFADHDVRLNGLVTTEVRRATGELNTLIRNEIDSRVTGLRPVRPV